MCVGSMYVGVSILRTLVSPHLQHPLQLDVPLQLSHEPASEQQARVIPGRPEGIELGAGQQTSRQAQDVLVVCCAVRGLLSLP